MPTCPHCHGPLRADGSCPPCLLALGLAGHSADPQATVTAPRRTVALPDLPTLRALLPQYDILALHGRGGMGAVYRARHRGLDRVVALKVLATGSSGAAQVERFTTEARSLARLDHPHIVAIHDVGQVDGLCYLVMEFVAGGNLRQALTSGTLSSSAVLVLVQQVCAALQYAHDHGVVHRDIKPENILLDERGQVKIADFGLARLLDGTSTERLTAVDAVMGTPHYMAPEQVERPREVDHRADIFALGVVFYELLTGSLPLGRFPPPSAHAKTQGRAPGQNVDTRFDAVVLRALEKEPDRRFQQADEMGSRLADFADRTAAAPRRRWLPWALGAGAAALLVCVVLSMPSRHAVAADAVTVSDVHATAITPEVAALTLAKQLMDGQFDAATATFDTTMRAAVPASQLRLIWTTIAETSGGFQSFGTATASQSNGLTAVVIPCHFRLAAHDLTAVYSAAGQVAGLWIRPAASAATASATDCKARGIRFGALLAAGRMADAAAEVAPSARGVLSAEVFATVWRQAGDLGGAFLGFSPPQQTEAAGFQQVTQRGRWEHAQCDLRLTYGTDGQVIGVLLTPVP